MYFLRPLNGLDRSFLNCPYAHASDGAGVRVEAEVSAHAVAECGVH